jgi:hypothetical protein
MTSVRAIGHRFSPPAAMLSVFISRPQGSPPWSLFEVVLIQ